MTTEPKNTKTNTWVKILLVLSLGLNITIASFVIAVSIKGPPERPAPQNQDALSFLSYALPVEHRRELRRELLAKEADFRADRAALRGLRVELIRILQEEPFDITKVERLLARQREHFLSLGELAHDALIRRISDLSPAEREIYINSLRREARPQRNSN